MKKQLNFKNLLLMILMLSSTAFVAQSTISGTVKDQAGELLPGVSIMIIGTNIGTTTDFDGKYSLKTTETGTVELVFSYIGYSNKTISLDLSNSKSVTQNVILSEDLLGLDEVVITGNLNPKSKLESSTSISTLKSKDIANIPARTTAELLRSIPGIRSESSGGDGNSNISVRGIPGAGGSKYVQLQEDGLPVLAFGDIAFGTADIFIRSDRNVSRIEAIRGGSASTLATNAPGGIINFVSKTGSEESGSIATTLGLDYNSTRTDFEFGSPIGNGLSFHIGGFYRRGEGVRRANFTANQGGQLKANLTKEFKNGFARVYFKALNDRSATYMPMPMQISGSESNPTYNSLPGFDALRGGLNSPYMLQNVGLGSANEGRITDVADGMRPKSTAIGGEVQLDLGSEWVLNNKFRANFNSGRFVAPFPATFGNASSLVERIGGTGATANYVGSSTPLNLNSINGNGLAMIINMFDTELNNFNNFTNDIRVTKKIEKGDSKISLTGGLYKSTQNVNMSWLWNGYITDVNSDGVRPLELTNQAGDLVSPNGQYAYGVPEWGNCCQRNYDLKYDLSAPYVAIAIEKNKLSIDGSLRFDRGSVRGSYAGALVVNNLDVNNDGSIQPIEETVATVDNLNRSPVNYEFNYLSYSLGANYKINDNSAAFGRISKGGVSKADRLIFTPNIFADGTSQTQADFVNQFELGYKRKWDKGGLFVTGFYSTTTEEGSYQATSQLIEEDDYSALGVEIESNLRFGDFDARTGITWTKAEITQSVNAANIGNKPQRQADFLYNASINYSPLAKDNPFFGGLSVIGTTDSYTKNSNELVQPGYATFNSFLGYNVTESFSLSLMGNNIFNSMAITEVEEASLAGNTNQYVRARPLPGRSLSLTAVFNF